MDFFAPKKIGIEINETFPKLAEFVAVHKDILDYFEGIKNSLTACLAQREIEKEIAWLQAIEPQILALYKLKFFVENVRNDSNADYFMQERADFAKTQMQVEAIGEVVGLFAAYNGNKSKTTLPREEPKVLEKDMDTAIIRFLNRVSLQINIDFSVLKNYVQFERVAGLRPEFVDFFHTVEDMVDLMNKLIMEEFIHVQEGHKILDKEVGGLLLDTQLLNSIGSIQFYFAKLKEFEVQRLLSRELEKEKEETDHLISRLEANTFIDFNKLISTFFGEHDYHATKNKTKQPNRGLLRDFVDLLTQLLDKQLLVGFSSDGQPKSSQFYILDKSKLIVDIGLLKTEKQVQSQFFSLQSLEQEFEGIDVLDWKKEVALEFARAEVLIGQLSFHGLTYGAKFLEQKIGEVLELSTPKKVTELAQFLDCYELITSILCEELFSGNLTYELEDGTHYFQVSSLDFLEKVVLFQDEELVEIVRLGGLCQRLKIFYRQVQRMNQELALQIHQLAKQLFAHIAQDNELSVSGFRFSAYNPKMDKVFGTMYQFLEKEIALIDNYFVGKDILFYEQLVITFDMVKLYNSLLFKGLNDEFRTRDPEYPPQRKLFSGAQLTNFERISDTLSVLRSLLISMEKEAQREDEMEDTYPIVERMITMNNLAFRKLPYLKEHLLANNQQFFQKVDQKYLLSPNTTEVQLKELCFEKGIGFIEFHNFLLNLDRFILLYSELESYLYTYRPLRNGTNTLANYYVFMPIIPEDNSFVSVLKKVFVGSNRTGSALFTEKYERFKRQKFSSKEFRDVNYLENTIETLQEWKNLLIEYRIVTNTDKYDDDFTN